MIQNKKGAVQLIFILIALILIIFFGILNTSSLINFPTLSSARARISQEGNEYTEFIMSWGAEQKSIQGTSYISSGEFRDKRARYEVPYTQIIEGEPSEYPLQENTWFEAENKMPDIVLIENYQSSNEARRTISADFLKARCKVQTDCLGNYCQDTKRYPHKLTCEIYGSYDECPSCKLEGFENGEIIVKIYKKGYEDLSEEIIEKTEEERQELDEITEEQRESLSFVDKINLWFSNLFNALFGWLK